MPVEPDTTEVKQASSALKPEVAASAEAARERWQAAARAA